MKTASLRQSRVQGATPRVSVPGTTTRGSVQVFGPKKDSPMEDLLRARLRIPEGADRRLYALRRFMEGFDALNRVLFGQAFFAVRESEALLVELDGRTGPALLDVLMSRNGGTTITAHGLEHVPTEGAVVIGSTHPIGTFDFVAHAAALMDHRPDLKVVAGREAERFLGSELIIAVDMDSKDKVLSARETVTAMLAHLRQGGALLVFGSGRVPRMEKGLLVEPPWRTGVTRVSAETDAPIVPASLDLRNSRHYYRTRRLAGFLSGGNDEFGRRVASLRYASELIAKLGGSYDVHYRPAHPPGTAPEVLKELCEAIVPGLYQRG